MKKIILFLLLSVAGFAGGDKYPSPIYLTPYGVALKPYSSLYTSFQLPASGYLGFGTKVGTLGYGIRDNGGQIEFKGSGGVWTAIPFSTGSAGGFTNLSGSTKIYNTTPGNAVHIRTAAGDTTLTGMANVYGILNVKNSGGTETATLGTEALAQSSFDDSTGWNFGAGWWTSTTVGSVTHVVGNTATLTQAIDVVNGTMYQVTVTMTRTAGSITFQLGSLDIAYSGITSNTTKTFTASAVTPLTFTVTPTADFSGSFTEISIKHITAGSVTSLANFHNAAGTLSGELRTNIELTNQFFGLGSGRSNTTGNYNTANGMYALYYNTTGTYNTANGVNAGRYITGGSVENTTGSTSVFIGNTTKALADSNTNQIVIGDTVTGKGSNTVTIGNSLTTDVYLSSDSGATVHAGAMLVAGQYMTVPDYVFEDSYKQNSITEMRDFYLTNKHLPTMPSGKEVNSKAIDIMQYSMKLLETLEVQAKYISELELRISALEKK